MNKAIFFDRDGVVNYRIVGEYVRDYSEFKLIPDFIPFFKVIKQNGFLAIMISNQQGIGKGLMNENELAEVHKTMQKELLNKTGYQFDDIYFSADLAESNSYRRKPNPGMIIEAIDKWNIDILNSWMIGDKQSDVIAGKSAGVRTVLLHFDIKKRIPEADYFFKNLIETLNLFKSIRIID